MTPERFPINNRRRILLGLPIYKFTMPELIDEIHYRIINNISTIVYGYSASIYSRLRAIPQFVDIFNKIDIVVADGQGVPLLSKLFGVDLENRIGIVKLTYEILKLADENKYSILLFGASEENNKLAVQNVQQQYPNIPYCRGINGYFKPEEEEEIVKIISSAKPDILLIGISSPIKEEFALKYKFSLGTKLIIPCGGMLDVLAGVVKRPKFTFKWLPVTWIYRFMQEPRRLFKPIILPVIDFMFNLLPRLYLRHILNIEKNPSIINLLKLNVTNKIST